MDITDVLAECVNLFGEIVVLVTVNVLLLIIYYPTVGASATIQTMSASKKIGFTLIELLVAIAILGILATVGLGNFQSSQIKSRDAQRKSDLSQIQKALEMYYNDRGGYPLTTELQTLLNSGSSWTGASGQTIYMKTVPKGPKGESYCYESDGTYYKIYAKLENTKDPKIITPSSSVCTAANGYNYGVSSSNVAP